MKISTVNPGVSPLKNTVNSSKPDQAAEGKVASKEKPKKDEFVPRSQEKVNTYGKDIAKLKEQSEEAYRNLRMIVTQLLERQGYTLEKLDNEAIESIKVDETARAEAAELIADDGPLGAEAVSNRIVDFAIAISGGDTSKLDLLKGAIDNAFEQVEDKLGSLPDISTKTYDLIMEKLDSWAAE